jgi:hypothetical protein
MIPPFYFWVVISNVYRKNGVKSEKGSINKNNNVTDKHTLNFETPTFYLNDSYEKYVRASEGTLSRWSRLHLSLAPTSPH